MLIWLGWDLGVCRFVDSTITMKSEPKKGRVKPLLGKFLWIKLFETASSQQTSLRESGDRDSVS